MVFTLEALNAEEGDSLLLHYGKMKSPKHILIDGGPKGVFRDTLKERLNQLKEDDSTTRLAMVMVSHLDSDHIAGLCPLFEAIDEAAKKKPEVKYLVSRLWLNTFNTSIKGSMSALSTALGGSTDRETVHETDFSFPDLMNLPLTEPASTAFISSVKEGISIITLARKLGIPVNKPFKGLVIAPPKGGKTVDMKDGLKLTVIAPDEKQIAELEKEWNKKLKEIRKALTKGKTKEAEVIAAEYLDKTATNLSSIVVLAEADGKRMLLTGDARGDLVIQGLQRAGLLKKGKIHVDLLKLPHHGSNRNADTDFFETITADNYVISSNGKNGNPEIETLKMLIKSRGSEEFRIYLTNCEDRLVKFFDGIEDKKFDVVFRGDNDLSVQVKLGE